MGKAIQPPPTQENQTLHWNQRQRAEVDHRQQLEHGYGSGQSDTGPPNYAPMRLAYYVVRINPVTVAEIDITTPHKRDYCTCWDHPSPPSTNQPTKSSGTTSSMTGRLRGVQMVPIESSAADPLLPPHPPP